MAYKSIVTVLKNAERDLPVLAAASGFAQAHGAHLTALCIGFDRAPVTALYGTADMTMLQQCLEQAQAEASALEEVARAHLDQSGVAYDTQTFPVQPGGLNYIVGSRAQFSDLVILPKPYGPGRGREDVAVAEAALFATRSPVLFLPEDGALATPPESVILGWNESPEALTAIRAAMPLIETAGRVNIAIIDPPTHGEDRSDPGGALAQMLSRHDIHADIAVLAKTLPTIAEVLCRHVRDRNADLLVMGAYGHSRFREAVLGGATRHMLEMAEVPVLMMH